MGVWNAICHRWLLTHIQRATTGTSQKYEYKAGCSAEVSDGTVRLQHLPVGCTYANYVTTFEFAKEQL